VSAYDPLYVAALAREIRDSDYVHVGAQQDDVWAAIRLARALWAPRVRVVASGTFLLSAAPTTRGDIPRTYARDVVASRAATFNQTRVFDDLRRERMTFAGGIEVDGMGNSNLVGIYEDGELKVRGPGSGGLPTLTSHTSRFFIAVRRHVPRVLVERTSRISVLGDPVARAAAGLPSQALRGVITPLARFEPGETGLQLTEIAPGMTVEEIQSRTGFRIKVTAQPHIRPPVSDDERAVLTQLLNVNDWSGEKYAR
jgi:acyl CoA:acetate/3-ketoacid CoA transferase beta subunit